MLDWLLAGLDSTRPHAISDWESWHARINFFSWIFLAPVAVIVARFFKVMPWQEWPRELDNQTWWHFHWVSQVMVVVLTIAAVLLLRMADQTHQESAELHRVCGYIVLALGCFQIVLGLLRGSKGGPTDPCPDGSLSGHHYSMTYRRRIFEKVHKSVGYLALGLASFTVIQGFWVTNAPRWMWLLSTAWWLLLISVFVILQKKGRALDTYQAIWGPGRQHPGNLLPKQGWGTCRIDSADVEASYDHATDRSGLGPARHDVGEHSP